MKDTVLIVEDDMDIADLIRVNLAELDINIDVSTQGDDGYQRAISKDYSLIMLDVMLPGMNGLDICQEVRKRKPHQAIILITSKNAELDRVLGLELGADDYIIKPFSIRELQARVRVQLRKAQVVKKAHKGSDHPAESAVTIGTMYINPKHHQVLINHQPIDLTATEFDLLLHLASYPNQVFSRAQLLESVWGYGQFSYQSSSRQN